MSTALGRSTDQDVSTLTEVADFDALDDEPAAQLLFECLPCRRWAREVGAGRPYRSMRQLLTAAEDVLADLSRDDVEQCGAALGQGAKDDLAAACQELRTTMRRNLLTTLR